MDLYCNWIETFPSSRRRVFFSGRRITFHGIAEHLTDPFVSVGCQGLLLLNAPLPPPVAIHLLEKMDDDDSSTFHCICKFAFSMRAFTMAQNCLHSLSQTHSGNRWQCHRGYTDLFRVSMEFRNMSLLLIEVALWRDDAIIIVTRMVKVTIGRRARPGSGWDHVHVKRPTIRISIAAYPERATEDFEWHKGWRIVWAMNTRRGCKNSAS